MMPLEDFVNVEIFGNETDEEKKIILESLKDLHLDDEVKIDTSSENQSTSSGNDEQESYDEVDLMVEENEIDEFPNRKILLSLCSKTPILMTALEMGISAQMYLTKGEYQLAYENFDMSLDVLELAFKSEPAGIRRELLYVQIDKWLDQFASANAKHLLSMKEDEENSSFAENKCKKNKKFGNRVLSIFLNGLKLLFD